MDEEHNGDACKNRQNVVFAGMLVEMLLLVAIVQMLFR